MRRAFSLVEVLITAGLALGLVTLIALVLVQTARVSSRGVAIGQLQQSAMTAVLRLQNDLQACNSGGVSLLSGPPVVLACCQQTGVTTDARPLYDDQNLVAWVWRPESGRLLRRSGPWPGLNVNLPTRLSPVELDQLASQPNFTEVTAASDVTAFSLTSSAPAGQIGTPLQIQLTLSRQVAANQPAETFSVTRSLVLRTNL